MNNPIMILAVFSAFIIVFVASCWIHRKFKHLVAEEKAWSRTPFGEKMLRPAGEGLRLKLEEIHDEMMEVAMLLAVFVVAPIFGALIIMQKLSWYSIGTWVIVSGVAYYLTFNQWKKLLVLRRRRKKYQLGFDGERYIAEKTIPLVRMGYRVFHDFEVDWLPGKRFNIDHIAIGPNGVFVIETKARKKRNGEMADGKESHVLKVTGGKICFPLEQPTDEPITQARMNAEVLGKWIAGSSGKNMPVFPVLAFPGWWVEDQEKGDVRVISGNGIEKCLPHFGESGILDEREVARISDVIEKKCRNVEGA
jgi:hypothetical protein